MKSTIFFGVASALVFISCNNSTDQTTTTSTDSTSSSQSNAASVPANDNSSNAGTNSANSSFKEVMNQMMSSMSSMQMTQDPDQDFAMMMKVHHQEAINMSNIELSKGTNADLKQVAQKTIDDSQKDISDLNNFLSNHQPSKKSDFSKNQMDKMKSMNMDMKESGDVDKDFVMMMTKHHQQGIDMAKDYLKVATENETKKIAKSSIKSNQEGIEKLQKFNGNTSKDKDMKGMDMNDTKMDKPSTNPSQQ